MKLGENVLIIRARERMFLRREKADKPVQRADEYIFLAMRDGQSDGQLNALVAEREGVICGFACISYVERAETPYSYARRYYEIEEFGVDPAFHRQGVATELFDYMKE